MDDNKIIGEYLAPENAEIDEQADSDTVTEIASGVFEKYSKAFEELAK